MKVFEIYTKLRQGNQRKDVVINKVAIITTTVVQAVIALTPTNNQLSGLVLSHSMETANKLSI